MGEVQVQEVVHDLSKHPRCILGNNSGALATLEERTMPSQCCGRTTSWLGWYTLFSHSDLHWLSFSLIGTPYQCLHDHVDQAVNCGCRLHLEDGQGGLYQV